MGDSLPLVLEIAQAIALIAIPVVGAFIAYRQMRLAEMTVRHALFDRRFIIYEAVMGFVAKIVREGNVDNPEILDYSRRIIDAEFLFDEKVAVYLRSLFTRAGQLHVDCLAADPAKGDLAAIDRKYAGLNFFAAQFDVIKDHFRPFLWFEQPSAARVWLTKAWAKRPKWMANRETFGLFLMYVAMCAALASIIVLVAP